MNLYPAIDLYQDRVVRLTRGDYQKETVYSDDPAAMAAEWAEQGAQWLHIVDLEGAKAGEIKNEAALKAIRKSVTCPIEFGGGLRSLEAVQKVLDAGINRAVIGTRAMDEGFLTQLLKTFGSAIAVGLDIRQGKVQMEGWLKEGGKTLEEALEWLNHFPVQTVIYTDIHKDGMLEGPNFEGLQKVLELSRSQIILSGGISGLKDIEEAAKLHHPRLEGVIIGKALYEKKFNVREALETVHKARGSV